MRYSRLSMTDRSKPKAGSAKVQSATKSQRKAETGASSPASDGVPSPSPSLPGLFGNLSEMQGGQLAQRCMLWALQWMHDRAAERP